MDNLHAILTAAFADTPEELVMDEIKKIHDQFETGEMDATDCIHAILNKIHEILEIEES